MFLQIRNIDNQIQKHILKSAGKSFIKVSKINWTLTFIALSGNSLNSTYCSLFVYIFYSNEDSTKYVCILIQFSQIMFNCDWRFHAHKDLVEKSIHTENTYK